MANSYNTVSVTGSATLVIASNGQRRGVFIYNNGTAIVYLGLDTNVLATTGIPLFPDPGFEWSRTFDGLRDSIYAIAASGTQDVRYMEWE